MYILVTNDDGVTAPGLLALTRAMREIGEVSVLAPDRNWSGGGHVKTLERPLRIKEVFLDDGTPALTSDGAPSDCVALAMLGYLDQPVDLVVSGINPTANIGHDVTYSGTVTAAMEAVIAGVPGIAVSLNSEENHLSSLAYEAAAYAGQYVVREVIQRGLPKGILLNVNVPHIPLKDLKGFQLTRQGLRVYRAELDQRVDPRGKPYYWIGGDLPTGIPETGTDFEALESGYVSITPLQLDLTAYPALHAMKTWDLEHDEWSYIAQPESAGD
jgi:5'-nucleotidase